MPFSNCLNYGELTKKFFASVYSNLSYLEYPTFIYFAIQIFAQCGAIYNNMCRIKGSKGEQKWIAIRFEHRCPYDNPVLLEGLGPVIRRPDSAIRRIVVFSSCVTVNHSLIGITRIKV